MRNAVALIGFLLAVASAATFGGYFTASGVRDWYPTLAKPPWQPPAWIFGPVWTVLYLLIATAGFLAWRHTAFTARRMAMPLFAIQLLLNAAWSWIFFGLRQPGWAFAEILLLWTAILATTVTFFRLSRPAGALLIPYLLWVTFASALNFEIWRLNRHTTPIQANTATI
jgi:tryptophan-rich sensory protein